MKQHVNRIWFLIGVLLAIYGVLILAAGIYNWFAPAAHPVQLAGLHSGIWWGGVLLALGLFYIGRYRRV